MELLLNPSQFAIPTLAPTSRIGVRSQRTDGADDRDSASHRFAPRRVVANSTGGEPSS
jgi:hypothetical protein